MTSRRRLAALEHDLQIAEQVYRDQLTEALETCSHGVWGLLGANDVGLSRMSAILADRLRCAAVNELLQLGGLIADLRERLGYVDAFSPHERFLYYRSVAIDRNAPGEPTLARQFLAELRNQGATMLREGSN
jgi:hypothetical protein